MELQAIALQSAVLLCGTLAVVGLIVIAALILDHRSGHAWPDH